MKIDITFAYYSFIGILLMYLSLAYSWIFVPGEVGAAEAGLQGDELGGDGSIFAYNIDSRGISWIVGPRINLQPVVWLSLITCMMSLLRGFTIVNIPWRVMTVLVVVPYGFLVLGFLQEVLRGSTILGGGWMFLGGGLLVVFGTVMTKPRITEPDDARNGGNAPGEERSL